MLELFVLWRVCVGVLVLFGHCLLNVCVPRARCPRSVHPLRVFLLSVPSSCLVACRRFVLLFMLVMVGFWFVLARVVPAFVAHVCLCMRACVALQLVLLSR